MIFFSCLAFLIYDLICWLFNLFNKKGTFSYVYMGYFKKNNEEKVALKYIIPTSAPTRTKQEIECLLNFGYLIT